MQDLVAPAMATLALVALGGYLLGSIPFGVVITRAAGAGDVRNIGSGNIGATNVLRTGRKDLALATLLLDAGKGAAALLIAKGYRILARRFRTPYGEIDLVVRRRNLVAFVEVKARGAMDEALIAITPEKHRLVEARVRQWLALNPWAMDHHLRADAVFLAPGAGRAMCRRSRNWGCEHQVPAFRHRRPRRSVRSASA